MLHMYIFTLRRTKTFSFIFLTHGEMHAADFFHLRWNVQVTLRIIRREAAECASLRRRKRHFYAFVLKYTKYITLV